MKKINILLSLILIINLVMLVVIYQQNKQLNKYELLFTNIEGKLEDIDDAIDDQIIPNLKK
ncbi:MULTISPECIES: hypothetical protein [Bacillus]|uniref:Uncharacterized protein n=2 Tax=Bacillus TaxID=1386 RepID=A0A0M5JF54_9BACI|nr:MULTISPECIES: hypothetical protein [Bacillus]ALC83931.1 hypothetical protein AM592_22345 [Bacillus gobiensis]MBP1082999.1 hypothetical protein [Bacillus capparidis]MED1098027.1 hypothetical protein [Bacillus capparidis]